MKQLVPLLQNSQRDSRWGSQLLGNNTLSQFNIYNYGCLETTFGNYIGKTPADVNTIKGIFTQGGGDFVWGQCGLLGLQQVYASQRYEDAVSADEIVKMKAFIDQGKPLVTEIDFNPSTVNEESHYVLIIGYDDNGEFIVLDPWTGTIVSLAVYGGVNRAVYAYHVYDKVLAVQNQVPSNPNGALSDCQTALKDKTDNEKKLNDAITRKDGQIKAIYLGLPEADTAIIDPDQQAKLITDAVLNWATYKISTDKQLVQVSGDLLKCQQKPDSSVAVQNKLNDLQKKYDKLKATPSKAIISILLAIAEKIGASV